MDILSKNPLSDPEKENSLTLEEKLTQIEDKLQTQRDEWGEKLVSLIENIKNIDKLADSQVLMLSYRQIIIEHLTKFRIRLKKSQSAYEREFKVKFISYFNYDYKITDKYKSDMIHADLFFYRRQIGLLEAQIEFFKECVNTLDKMGFAIKNRVSFEEL